MLMNHLSGSIYIAGGDCICHSTVGLGEIKIFSPCQSRQLRNPHSYPELLSEIIPSCQKKAAPGQVQQCTMERNLEVIDASSLLLRVYSLHLRS